MKLQECKGRFSVSVPKQYVKLLQWKRGTELLVVPDLEKEGTLLIKAMPKK